jgi:hypothetical protein
VSLLATVWSRRPLRFDEALDVFHWAGETILGDNNPRLVGEVGFLEASATNDTEGGDAFGRIDMRLRSRQSTSRVTRCGASSSQQKERPMEDLPPKPEFRH